MMRSPIFVLVCVALGGCAAPITSDVRVTDPAPTDTRIEQVAVLPVIVDTGLEEWGRVAGDEMVDALAEEFPGVRVMAPDRTLQLMNDANLASAYAYLVGEYEQTGELDSEIVREIAQSLDLRYLLSLRLMYGEESGLGAGDFAGEVSYTGQGLRAVAQLWDGRRGTMTWRSVGEVSAVSSDLMQRRGVEELIAEVVPELVDELPVHGGEPLAQAPRWQPPADRSVFMGASGVLLLVFLLL